MSTPPTRAAGPLMWGTTDVENADDSCLGDALRAALQGGPRPHTAPASSNERTLRRCGPRLRLHAAPTQWATEVLPADEKILISSGEEDHGAAGGKEYWQNAGPIRVKTDTAGDGQAASASCPMETDEAEGPDQQEKDAIQKAVAHATKTCGGPGLCAWCDLEVLARDTKRACASHGAAVREHPLHLPNAASTAGAVAGAESAEAGSKTSAPIVGPVEATKEDAAACSRPGPKSMSSTNCAAPLILSRPSIRTAGVPTDVSSLPVVSDSNG